ncbi:MAG: HAMP domain-containing histidine kinase [Deltaproteobacteria bacterium]|nr:HAMP domain-containing histidine kinase [Deltaproteobacteria bacterium]
MVRRVALTAAAAAIAASAVTLVVALIASDRRAISNAERDALGSARAVLAEIPTDADHATLVTELREEVKELVPRRFSVAIYDRDRRVAGADTLPARFTAREGCLFAPGPEGEWLLCAALDRNSDRVLVAGMPRDRVLSHRRPLLFGGLIALLVVGSMAVLGGILVARYSLRPLVQLRRALEGFQTSRESSQTPPTLPRSDLVEIDIVVVTLQRLLDQLDAEVLRARRFAADAAHELRTPLTKIQADLELMREDLGAQPEHTAQATRLVARVGDLGTLVERLLVLASPLASLRAQSLVSLAATLEAELEGISDAARVRTHVEDDGLVRGDPSLLAAVVSNAVGNALKFSDGPVDVRVFVSGQEVVLRVDARGPGLSPEARDRAFDGFYRAPEHRSRSGHGIGLALIAHVVAAHEGVCAFVDDAPGAHLEIRLPKHSAAAD